MLPTRHFIDLTQPEIAQQLKKNPLVILPAGSVEQHGPRTCRRAPISMQIEALAVLACRPDLVHLDRIDYSSDHSHGRKWDKLRRTRSYQPVLIDIRTIAATGWYGAPEHATVDKDLKMLNDIASAIAREATDIFRMLDEAQGGTAEM